MRAATKTIAEGIIPPIPISLDGALDLIGVSLLLLLLMLLLLLLTLGPQQLLQ